MYKYYIESSTIDGDVLHLSLKSKYSNHQLEFEPGQYICLSYKRMGRKSPFRCFSLTNVPGNNTFNLGIKMGGNFTNSLSKLPRGTEVEVLGPYGEFIVDKDLDEFLVFIAGGIGITPFMSIIRTLLATKDKIPIMLLYSATTSSSMPFINELIELSKKYPNFKLIPFISKKEDKPLDITVVNGRIEKSHIEKIVKKDYLTNTYFICGPKLFTEKMISNLESLGISEERIVTESFSEASQIRTITGRSIPKLTYLASAALVFLGVLGIAFLDLVRYVPKNLPKTTNSTDKSSGSNTQNINTTNQAQSQTQSQTQTQTQNSTSSNSTSTTTNNNVNNYTPPTTRSS